MMMASGEEISRRFDADGDGRLDRNEIAALFQAVHPRVSFTPEQMNAVIDEVFGTYGGEDLIGRNGQRITLDALLRIYDDGAGDLDRDFDQLSFSRDKEEELKESSSTIGSGASPISTTQLPPLPPRPRRAPWGLTGELQGLVRRLQRQRTKEGDQVKAAERGGNVAQSPSGGYSSPEKTGGSHQADDDGNGEGEGVSPRPSVGWDRQSSRASSLTSSSFSSATEDWELDYMNRPPASELEEIPSFRWLPPSLLPPPPPPTRLPESQEINWEQLFNADPLRTMDEYTVDGVDDINNWLVLGRDESSGMRCGVLLARGLKITWRDNRSSWRYHGEVAVLSEVCWLDVGAQVNAADFSPATSYVCLLVYKLSADAFGLGANGETQKASVSVGGGSLSVRTVRLQAARGWTRPKNDGAGAPRQRGDGWMEIELGEFGVKGAERGARGVVSMSLREVERVSLAKGGLAVRGIEVRPQHFPIKNMVRLGSTRNPRYSF